MTYKDTPYKDELGSHVYDFLTAINVEEPSDVHSLTVTPDRLTLRYFKRDSNGNIEFDHLGQCKVRTVVHEREPARD